MYLDIRLAPRQDKDAHFNECLNEDQGEGIALDDCQKTTEHWPPSHSSGSTSGPSIFSYFLSSEVGHYGIETRVRKEFSEQRSWDSLSKTTPLDFLLGEFICLSLLILDQVDWCTAQHWRSTGGRDLPQSPRLAYLHGPL